MEVVFYIIVALLVVWFFGPAINSVLKGAGEIASKEFEYHKDSQDFRLAKDYDRLHTRLVDADIKYGKADVRKKLAELSIINEEKDK